MAAGAGLRRPRFADRRVVGISRGHPDALYGACGQPGLPGHRRPAREPAAARTDPRLPPAAGDRGAAHPRRAGARAPAGRCAARAAGAEQARSGPAAAGLRTGRGEHDPARRADRDGPAGHVDASAAPAAKASRLGGRVDVAGRAVRETERLEGWRRGAAARCWLDRAKRRLGRRQRFCLDARRDQHRREFRGHQHGSGRRRRHRGGELAAFEVVRVLAPLPVPGEASPSCVRSDARTEPRQSRQRVLLRSTRLGRPQHRAGRRHPGGEPQRARRDGRARLHNRPRRTDLLCQQSHGSSPLAALRVPAADVAGCANSKLGGVFSGRQRPLGLGRCGKPDRPLRL